MDRANEDARDLRTGGEWTRLQRAKNDLIFIVSMLALAVARALPQPALRVLGHGVGAAAHALARKARRTAIANVQRVFPEMGDAARRAFVRRSFVTMGELLADAVALLRPRGGPLLVVTPDTRALLEEALREGRGVLFASAHLGPWERVAASLVAAGIPLTTLARESYDPRFTRLYERLRGSRGVRVVWRAPTAGAEQDAQRDRRPGAIAATVGIIRTLRRGGVLGVPMDLRARVPSCETPFLGHPAATPVGPARIALRTGAAVVVGTVAPRGDALVITATRIPTDGLDFQPDGGARDLTARINQELSRRILALPHAWVWMHERWTPSAEYDVNFGVRGS